MTDLQVVYDAFLGKMLEDEWVNWDLDDIQQDWKCPPYPLSMLGTVLISTPHSVCLISIRFIRPKVHQTTSIYTWWET